MRRKKKSHRVQESTRGSRAGVDRESTVCGDLHGKRAVDGNRAAALDEDPSHVDLAGLTGDVDVDTGDDAHGIAVFDAAIDGGSDTVGFVGVVEAVLRVEPEAAGGVEAGTVVGGLVELEGDLSDIGWGGDILGDGAPVELSADSVGAGVEVDGRGYLFAGGRLLEHRRAPVDEDILGPELVSAGEFDCAGTGQPDLHFKAGAFVIGLYG